MLSKAGLTVQVPQCQIQHNCLQSCGTAKSPPVDHDPERKLLVGLGKFNTRKHSLLTKTQDYKTTLQARVLFNSRK